MTAAQGFLATDAVLEGQESRNSLKNSLFAGNLPGDWSGQDCVASQAVGLSWGHFAEYEKNPPLAGFHALEAGSPSSHLAPLVGQIAESLCPASQIFPFSGDFGRRLGLLPTAR